jgi:hypothetical protein
MFSFLKTVHGTRRADGTPQNAQRRAFLRQASASAAATALLVTACKDSDQLEPQALAGRAARTADHVVYLGTGDVAVLNFAYALEQLEAAFYIEVVKAGTLRGDELALMTDIRDHEIAHREFFKNALGSAAIKGLTPDFSKIDFRNRLAIIDAAQAFEDLGVMAYNGAGKFIKNPDYLELAGKIVSVEARHAAYLRDLFIYNNFANSVDNNALDRSKSPAEVLFAAGMFIREQINLEGSGLL